MTTMMKKAEPTNTKDADFTHVLLSCLADLNAVAALIEYEFAAKHDGLWEDEEYMGLRINPIAHRLLDGGRPTLAPAPAAASTAATVDYEQQQQQRLILEETLRLGAILWIIWIKRRYRSYPSTPTVYVSKLLGLLSTMVRHGWTERETETETSISMTSDLLSIRVWLLVLCGISSCSSLAAREQTTAVDMLAREMRQLGGDNNEAWAKLMVRVRQMPWVDVFEAPCTVLKGLVQEIR